MSPHFRHVFNPREKHYMVVFLQLAGQVYITHSHVIVKGPTGIIVKVYPVGTQQLSPITVSG
jgi:hypothetical protein